MKLRNKKTGEIIIPTDYTFVSYDDGIRYNHHLYYSLAELNEEWEDYKPTEPLIKDEKIRKVIRLWADMNDMSEAIYDRDKDCLFSPYGSDDTDISVSISFDSLNVFKELEPRKKYTITELCGEEE